MPVFPTSFTELFVFQEMFKVENLMAVHFERLGRALAVSRSPLSCNSRNNVDKYLRESGLQSIFMAL